MGEKKARIGVRRRGGGGRSGRTGDRSSARVSSGSCEHLERAVYKAAAGGKRAGGKRAAAPPAKGEGGAQGKKRAAFPLPRGATDKLRPGMTKPRRRSTQLRWVWLGNASFRSHQPRVLVAAAAAVPPV